MKTIQISSEEGDFEINDELIVKLHKTDDGWKITFFVDEMPFFSMGLDELPEFADAISVFDERTRLY